MTDYLPVKFIDDVVNEVYKMLRDSSIGATERNNKDTAKSIVLKQLEKKGYLVDQTPVNYLPELINGVSTATMLGHKTGILKNNLVNLAQMYYSNYQHLGDNKTYIK